MMSYPSYQSNKIFMIYKKSVVVISLVNSIPAPAHHTQKSLIFSFSPLASVFYGSYSGIRVVGAQKGEGWLDWSR